MWNRMVKLFLVVSFPGSHQEKGDSSRLVFSPFLRDQPLAFYMQMICLEFYNIVFYFPFTRAGPDFGTP